MSAIDFRTSVARKADPKGDRVVITLDGKVSFSYRSIIATPRLTTPSDGSAVLALFIYR